MELNLPDAIQLKIGDISVDQSMFSVFDSRVMDFISNFRESLISFNSSRNSELSALIFYLRRANIEKIKLNSNFSHEKIYVNRGIAYHICPSNVPTTFAYSFIWGLVSGCINIIKIPSVNDPAKEKILKSLIELSERKENKDIFSHNLILNYDKKSSNTEYLSSISDVRIAWGSDHTIEDLKKNKTKPNNHDIFFPDRISACIISENEFNVLSEDQIVSLAKRFVRDFADYNQLACSSPSFVIWVGDEKFADKKIQFWSEVSKEVSQKKIGPEISGLRISKTIELMASGFLPASYAQSDWEIKILRSSSNSLKFLDVTCGYGNFIEYTVQGLNLVFEESQHRLQTITYFGFSKELLQELSFKQKFQGIDRIVPIGSALDLENIWDGFNIVHEMVKEICIR